MSRSLRHRPSCSPRASALFVEHNDIDEPGMHTHLVERQGRNADRFELMLAGPS